MYNVSMPSREQLLSLLNEQSGLSMTWDQIEFGVPNINSNPTYDRNTEIELKGIPDFGYKGSTYIYYNRIDLAEFEPLARDPFIVQVDVAEGDALTIQHIIDGFNRYFGSAIEAEDISQELVLPDDYSNGVAFTMEAAAWSLAYRGGVDFTIRPMDVDIDVAVDNKLLEGLVLTMPPEE